MDITRAKINLKEGIIELEGSEEFVEKHLNEYKSLLSKTENLQKFSPKDPPNKLEKKKQQKRRARTSGPTCTNKVQELIDNGYLTEPRYRTDIQDEILKNGARFESSLVSATLNNLYKSGKLKRTGTGKNAQYYTNL